MFDVNPGSFLTNTGFILLSLRSGPLSRAGRGCWITSWTSKPAVRQAESGNKAPYCPPLLALKDGINWPDKRYQRKVLLRVLRFNRPLYGSRPENRKLPSVIKAGLHALTTANEAVLITREVSSSPWNLLKSVKIVLLPERSPSTSAFLLVWPVYHLFISSYTLSTSLPVPDPSLLRPENKQPPWYR